jgi:putative transposase
MSYDPDKHHRRSIRLREYDYRQEGAYFVTICTYQRACLFGDVVDEEMLLSTPGCIMEEEIRQTPIVRPYVLVDSFIIMPNHIHAIFVITDAQVGTQRRCVPTTTAIHSKTFAKIPSGSLSAVIRSFKAIVTKRINLLRGTPSEPVWQGRYYEQIIRNQRMFDAIRQYIEANPAQWSLDRENPANVK